MATSCPDCGERFGLGRRRVTTTTGRVVCERCQESVLGAAAGILGSPDTPVGGAVSTSGWFQRLRRRRRRRP